MNGPSEPIARRSRRHLAGAERAARKLITTAPLSETGYRLLMRVLIVRAETAEALTVYERLRRGLRDEFGVEPAATTQDIHHRLIGAPTTAKP